MADHPAERSPAAVRHTVASLDQQAADLRAELLRLRNQLHDVESDLEDSRAAQLREANEQLVLALVRAQSSAEVAAASLAALSDSHQRDGLTGLPNRTLGLDRLANAIDMARRHGKRVAVLFLDLDQFKAVNDQLGHAGGDQLLQLATQRLQSVLRESDTVCRYGGDEFLIILPDVAEAVAARQLAGKLLAALRAPGRVGGRLLRQTASVGVSLYPDDGEDAATLINCADAAMYRCKRRAGGGLQFHAERAGDEERHELPSDQLQPPSASPADVPANSTSHQQDLREANQQLLLASLSAQESAARARDANGQQLKFMAMVAHELRHPLTPLRMATEMLARRGAGGEAATDRLALIINDQVARMARLIDDLLEGSRLGTGKLRLEFGMVDVVRVLEHAVMACRPKMQAHGQRLSVDLLPGPLTVNGDSLRLAQIFNNLLDNACKYTPEGGEIMLGMTVAERSLVVSVRDNGVGIAVEMVPLVFDLFVQEAHVLAHSSGGLGIGLAVVRDLVEAHGGTVVARSAGRDRGSEFVVTLPLG